MSTPSGPAGGDLAGNYPNPQVTSISNVPAHGDLSGFMGAPDVVSIAHVTTGPAVYPAGSGQLLTNLPTSPPITFFGTATLDNAGTANITFPQNLQGAVATWADIAGTGQLFIDTTGTQDCGIQSSAGPVDAGLKVYVIAM